MSACTDPGHDTEHWRPVVGSPGYEVSCLGGVRNARTGRELAQQLQSKGYLRLHLGRKRLEYVHTLVAEAFIGPRPPGMEVDHIDRSRVHNAASNLRWMPAVDNARRWYTEREPEPEAPQPWTPHDEEAWERHLATVNA